MSCPAVVVDRPGPWPPRRPRSPPPPSPQASTCPYQASSRPRPAPSTTGRSPPRCRHRTTSWRCPSKWTKGGGPRARIVRRSSHISRSGARRIPIRPTPGPSARLLPSHPRVQTEAPCADPPPPPPWPSPRSARPPAAHSAGPQPGRSPRPSPSSSSSSSSRMPWSLRRCGNSPSRPTLPPPPRGRGGCLGHGPPASSTAATRGGGRRPPGRLSREPRWIGRPSPSRSRCRTGTPRPPRLPLPGDRAAPQLRAWRFFFPEAETRDRAGTSAG